MKDFLQLVEGAGAMERDGGNGYTVAGKPVDRGRAWSAISGGFLAWDGTKHTLTDKGRAKVDIANERRAA